MSALADRFRSLAEGCSDGGTRRSELGDDLTLGAAELDRLTTVEAERDRYKRERHELLGVKTTEGLSAAEWMSRTARAEAEVVRLAKGHDEYNRVNQLLEAENDRLGAIEDAARKYVLEVEAGLRDVFDSHDKRSEHHSRETHYAYAALVAAVGAKP